VPFSVPSNCNLIPVRPKYLQWSQHHRVCSLDQHVLDENLSNNYLATRFQYVSTINAIAANPVPEESNCTITSGFDDIQSSVLITDVPWVTVAGTPADVDYDFIISGLADAGTTTAFYLTIQCPLADWWPRVYILNPSVN
jgi:hypothetical protein